MLLARVFADLTMLITNVKPGIYYVMSQVPSLLICLERYLFYLFYFNSLYGINLLPSRSEVHGLVSPD